jgi:hypothetical protein
MKRPFWFAGCVAAVSVGVSARAAEFILQPVRASGAHTIVGTEIRLEGGGQRVFLEIKIKGFAPHLLTLYQAGLNSGGFSSGTAGILGSAVQPCPSMDAAGNAFCQTAFGDTGLGGSSCVYNESSPYDFLHCKPVWINQSRMDWVFYGRITIAAVRDAWLDYSWGALDFSGQGVSDEGATYYAGGLAIDVPANAVGTFTIGFIRAENDTLMLDENILEIGPLLLTPARIKVLCLNNAQCDDGNACTLNDRCSQGVCIPGSPKVCTNGNQCNDAGTCNPQTGVCSAPVPKPNGTGCSDSNGCTAHDACLQGECLGTDIPGCLAWNEFALCLDGPGVPAEPACLAFDLNGDGFVDLSDVALMIPSQNRP